MNLQQPLDLSVIFLVIFDFSDFIIVFAVIIHGEAHAQRRCLYVLTCSEGNQVLDEVSARSFETGEKDLNYYMNNFLGTLLENGKVSKVALSRFDFSALNIRAILPLASLKSLRMLDLSKTKIDDVALGLLCEKIAQVPNRIQVLNLSGNKIATPSLLLPILGDYLTVLNLEKNGIDLCVAESFSQTLYKQNLNLVDVRLEVGLRSALDAVLAHHDNHLHGSDQLLAVLNDISKPLFLSMRNNFTAMSVRNSVIKRKKVHQTLTDVVIAMDLLQLPVYFLLFIVDCFPYWENWIPQHKKVLIIENVQKSIRKVKNQRK